MTIDPDLRILLAQKGEPWAQRGAGRSEPRREAAAARAGRPGRANSSHRETRPRAERIKGEGRRGTQKEKGRLWDS